MKLCLAAVEQREDLEFGLLQIEDYAKEAKERSAELILFPEAFLQGFEGLCFDYQKDILVAVSAQGAEIARVRRICKENGIGIGLGYFETEGGVIYSSYIIIDSNGKTIANYRRRSPGWKESYAGADYREGKEFISFQMKDKAFSVILCGDFWTDSLLDEISAIECDCMIWPVYIDFTIEDWESFEYAEYLERTQVLEMPVAFVNAYVEDPERANGGAFVAKHGRAEQELKMGKPALLYFTI